MKSTLADNEAIIHVDFSENYQCGYAREVQSADFGVAKAHVTLHTGVLYTSKRSISFTSISDNKRHDAHAVWAHLTPVLAYLRNDVDSRIQCLHFESDSPSGQYRNRSNAYLMSTIPFNMGYSDISWNYYEAGHGKGAPDAVGAAMKRNADVLVSHGRDVLNARNLYDELSPSTSIKLFLVTDEDIAEIDKLVPSSIPPAPGLMNVHQMKCAVDDIIDLFRLSCVCSRCNTECTCTPVRTVMKPAKKKSPEPRKARTGEKHRMPGSLKSTAANKRQKEDKAECCCLVCAEPSEKWIQCQNCKNWAHVECTGLPKATRCYLCDFC